MEEDWCFVKREREVCDARMPSPTFFRVSRSESGLDSCDSGRVGLGLSPVGCCSLPLKGAGPLHASRNRRVRSGIRAYSGRFWPAILVSGWAFCGFVLGMARVILG